MAVLGLSVAAPSQDHTWGFAGTLAYVSDAGTNWTKVGSGFLMRFVINSSQLQSNQTGIYFPIHAVYFEVAEGLGYGASMIGGEALVINDRPVVGGGTLDGFYLSGVDDHNSLANPALDGSDYGITLIRRSSSITGPPWDSTAFPSTLDLNDFTDRYMSAYYPGNVRGTIDSFYVDGVLVSQIPEPSGPILFGAGILILGCWVALRSRKTFATSGC